MLPEARQVLQQLDQGRNNANSYGQERTELDSQALFKHQQFFLQIIFGCQQISLGGQVFQIDF